MATEATWSMRAARRATGTPDRQARALTAAGWVPRSDLTGADVLALQVLTALTAHPANPDPDRPEPPTGASDHRAAAAADEARRSYLVGQPGWTLVVTPDDARIATDPGRLAALLATTADQVRLLLPVGAWAAQLRAQPALPALSTLPTSPPPGTGSPGTALTGGQQITPRQEEG
jgi:hypothetical protein